MPQYRVMTGPRSGNGWVGEWVVEHVGDFLMLRIQAGGCFPPGSITAECSKGEVAIPSGHMCDNK